MSEPPLHGMAWDRPPDSPSQPGAVEPSCWGERDSPLLLAGDDGNVHETRPTTTLARDLASEVLRQSTPPLDSFARRRGGRYEERVLRGCAAPAGLSSSSQDPSGYASGGHVAARERPCTADRVVLGGFLGGSSPAGRAGAGAGFVFRGASARAPGSVEGAVGEPAGRCHFIFIVCA